VAGLAWLDHFIHAREWEGTMVKIITDTTAGLPAEIAEGRDIPVIPQVVTFGQDSYLEGIEIDTATFMVRLTASKELPKTAAPPPELFTEHFRRFAAMGETILCIHPSTDLSGTVRSATVAAQDFPDADIRVIDTRSVAAPLATMVRLATDWADEGLDADTIVARIEDMIPRWQIYFLVSTLEYLAKGGRIGGASALIGSVLRIKPILSLVNGRVEPFEKERTHKRALGRLIELVEQRCPPRDSSYLAVMHAGVPEQGAELAHELGRRLAIADVRVSDVPPAIVTHTGPGLLAVGFLRE
jgi:DegV family protein with EDD domain